MITLTTDRLTPPSVPTGSLTCKDNTVLWKPVLGTKTMETVVPLTAFTLMMDTVFKTFYCNSILPQLVIWEDFTFFPHAYTTTNRLSYFVVLIVSSKKMIPFLLLQRRETDFEIFVTCNDNEVNFLSISFH